MPYPTEGSDQSSYSYQEHETTHVCLGNYYWRPIILAQDIIIIQLQVHVLAVILGSRLIDPVRQEVGVFRKIHR